MELMFKAGKLYYFTQEEMFYYFGYISEENEKAYYGSWRKRSKNINVSSSEIKSWIDYTDHISQEEKDAIKEIDTNKYSLVRDVQKLMIKKLFTGWLT